MQPLAPIVIFTYKRMTSLQRLIHSLQQNPQAAASTLIIYSDAAKGSADETAVKAVRDYLPAITGFRSIRLHCHIQNKGLAQSIIQGISEVVTEFGTAIVLEDDLVVSNNFLAFMNQGLLFYKMQPFILSIAAYTMPIQTTEAAWPYDAYFTQRASSWGWATWADRWDKVDWTVNDYASLRRDHFRRRRFNAMGSDMFGLLRDQQRGRNNSWAIRFCYHQFKNNLYTVYPLASKVINTGFDQDATHTTQKHNRFKTTHDNSNNQSFRFPTDIRLEPALIRQFTHLYSIPMRAIYKLKNLLHS